jgi:hypothetical protein
MYCRRKGKDPLFFFHKKQQDFVGCLRSDSYGRHDSAVHCRLEKSQKDICGSNRNAD